MAGTRLDGGHAAWRASRPYRCFSKGGAARGSYGGGGLFFPSNVTQQGKQFDAMGAFFLSFVFAWELGFWATQGKTRGRDETGRAPSGSVV